MYAAAIKSWVSGHHWRAVFELLGEMEQKGLPKDERVFAGAMGACLRAVTDDDSKQTNLAVTAMNLLSEMRQRKLNPSRKHWSMVSWLHWVCLICLLDSTWLVSWCMATPPKIPHPAKAVVANARPCLLQVLQVTVYGADFWLVLGTSRPLVPRGLEFEHVHFAPGPGIQQMRCVCCAPLAKLGAWRL